jgi:hypothetical protein
MARIYCASSWRNPFYETVIKHLTAHGHAVWDWRNPPTGGNGFRWQDVGAENYCPGDKVLAAKWCEWLSHPIAQSGFASDLAGMQWCDIGILLHPCGRSAHLEAGWLAGRGKRVHVLCLEQVEPDLMILALNGSVFGNLTELLTDLKPGGLG